MEEVAKHNSANDCWMVIRGSVLDLTSFSNHPGGSTYVPFCGTDATNAFDTKGGNGNPHSSYANSLLASFTIGQLGQPQDRNITNSTIPISGDDEDEYEEEYEDEYEEEYEDEYEEEYEDD
jgi:cytochrome b involved in lipid metabolism